LNSSYHFISQKLSTIFNRTTITSSTTWHDFLPQNIINSLVMKAKKKPAEKEENVEGTPAPFPADIQPMLATLVDKPVDEPGWMYEVKWDGYRAIAYMNEGKVEIRSRNNKSFEEKYYPIVNALRKWGINAVVDGEIVVVNEKGLPDFGDLQNWRSEADGNLAYYVFDILYFEGKDLMNVTLTDRRAILQSLAPQIPDIKISENFSATGTEFFELADKMGLEGIMAKKETSVYTPNARSKEWLKIKTEKHQELVIGGYTKNEGTPKKFSALLLGLFRDGAFHHVTPVGTGFNNKMQEEIIQKLQPLVMPDCPFMHVPEFNKPSRFRPNPPKADVTWVRPEMVCEISYREMTKGGAIRHPSFRGLREDKNAKEVVIETPKSLKEAIDVDSPEEPVEQVKKSAPKKSKAAAKKTTKAKVDEAELIAQNVITPLQKGERKTLLNPNEETQVKNVNGNDMKFTNLSKVYWPKENVTKRDMINYYYQVAEIMVPYYKDRPQTLNRYPHGIEGETFYQKDVKGKAPAWIKTFPYHSYTDGRDKEFLVCMDEASLLYIASLGCIEINPWSSRTAAPDNPDWCIIDLDPDKNTFEQVIETACVTKSILDAIEVPPIVKLPALREFIFIFLSKQSIVTNSLKNLVAY
jgi:bifunctional non-homologous end joining protein LigD